MRPKGRQMMAWLLTAAVTLSGNSFTVLADEMDFSAETEVSDVQALEEEAAISENEVQDEELTDETPVEQEDEAVFEVEEDTPEETVQEVQEETETVQEEISSDLAVFSDGETGDAYDGETIEDYQLPGEDVLLIGWDYWVNRSYNCYVRNEEYPDGTDLSFDITEISVENSAEEEDETPVCEINDSDENGWNIQAKRLGTAIVILTYKDIHGEEQQWGFKLYVDGDKFTLEPQWTADGNNMLPNSEMTISFTLHHEWKISDEHGIHEGNEDIQGWTLELDPDENGYAYDTNLLDVEVHGEEHTITIKSNENTWGTGISLRALHPADEDAEEQEPTYSYANIPIEVCEEYDVLYPENLENIRVGESLDFGQCGLDVKHIKADETVSREDCWYDFEYDTNQWENEAEEDQMPVLRRKTADETYVTVIAREDETNQEIRRREYLFEELDYAVWFENLREDEYNTYFFENEEGELRLNTENLKDKNASVEWKVGYRRDDQDDSRSDDFTTEMGIDDEMIFWSEKEDDDSVLAINGSRLWEAEQWLQEEKKDDYWFEVRAEVKVEGEEEPVYIAQAGIHGRELVEDYQLPGDDVLLVDQDYWIDAHYNCRVENPEHPDGEDLMLDVTDVRVSDVEEEESETPVCEVSYHDENGWNIHANRYGDSVVTVTYMDIHGEEQTHSFTLYVNSDKFILEPQWTSSESNMLKNSEMKLPFILRHEWKRSEEDWGEEEVKDWTLEFAPNEDGWYYDDNLLKSVQINGHELTVRSKEGIWGNSILLKATILSENGESEDVAYNDIWIEVRDEYDVLYPENIEKINLNETLDLNQSGLKVEHIKENADSYTRDDVTYDFEYDINQWTNEAPEGQLPILRRNTIDGTQVNVIARDGEGNEICRREYCFDGLDYSVWFEDMRQDEYSTYFFDNEEGELRLNTENLQDRNAAVEWEVGYRTFEDEEGNYELTSDMELPNELNFWSKKADDSSRLEINGGKLLEACNWLLKNKGENYWFEVRAAVKVGENTVEDVRAGISAREHVEQYYLNFGATLKVVPQEDIWLDNTLEWYVEDKDHPWGESIYTDVTKVKVLDNTICDLAYLDTGWRIKGIKTGESTLEVTYKDLQGEVKNGTFPLLVEDSIYYMDYEETDGAKIYPNSEKTINISVYNRKTGDAQNTQDEEISASDYTLAVQEDPYASDMIADIEVENNKQIVLNVGDIQYGEVSFALQAVSVAKDAEGKPLWTAETWFYYEITTEAQIKLNVSYIRESPEVQEEFDIKEYEPTLIRYDEEKKDWVEIKNGDDENIRLRLDYDEKEWKAKEGSEDFLLPVLVRQTDRRVGLSIIAEEREIDRFGIEHWNYLADYSTGFMTIYDAKEECRHKTNGLQTVKAATCAADGLKREVCEYCGKTVKEEKIPATGHKMSAWKTTKAATALATGMQERSCTVCGKKQQQTISKLKPTGALNVPSKLPLKVKQSYQLKVTGLAKGDSVVSWTSSNAKVAAVSKTGGKVTGKKAGSAVITANLKSGHKINVTVKVQKKDVATTSLTVKNKATGAKVPKTVSLKVKKKLTLVTTVAPLTSKQKVTYSSSDKKIATVSSKGVITAKKKGTVTITVKSGKKTVKVKVKVTK